MVGCRLNQSEIEGFANIFRALGHTIVSEPGSADLAIVNTCAVTVKAAADSRKKLRRAGREGAQAVLATGCWATLEPQVALDLPGVTKVIGNDQKDNLVADILGISQDRIADLEFVREPLPGDRAKTRTFIKVQEGCDNACTYCLTRLARGRSHSKRLGDIHRDIHAALAGGAKEIVLTGVQLGAWGREFAQPQSLRDLLVDILKNQEITRLRLSSIEPWDFDLSVLTLWQDERLCQHLHIPLQSGSDRILRKMERPISVREYVELIEKIREKIPDVALTTDVITGFPGETEHDFQATTLLIESTGFAGGHVFTYSPRPRTAAYNMEAPIAPQIAKTRNAALRTIFKRTSQTYRERFIDKVLPVLWESSFPKEDGAWLLSGLTSNYVRVIAESKADLWNEISQVKLFDHHPQRAALSGWIDEDDRRPQLSWSALDVFS